MSNQGLVNSLNSLLNPRQRKALKAAEPRGALPGRRVSVDYSAKSKGGGMASPLNEKTKSIEVSGQPQDVADRTYHDLTSYLYSDSRLLVVELRPLRNMTMVDANGDEHLFNFAKPVAP